LNAALDAIAWSPYTRIDLALAAATDELLGPRGRPDANRVIVLLTDGQPTHTTPQAVRDEAGLARSAGITIFTVGLGPDVDATLLADVAGDTDRYFPAPDGEDLEHIYAMIREKIPCK
jgi:nitric oxide reductase activation protein